MSETLLTLYIVTICAVFIVLLGWLVWMLVDHIRGNNASQEVAKKERKKAVAEDYGYRIAELNAEIEKLKEDKQKVAPAVEEVKKEQPACDYGSQIAEMCAIIKDLVENQAKQPVVEVVKETAEKEPVVEVVSEVAQTVTTAEETEEETVAVDDETVVLRRSETITYSEAYAALSKQDKRYADEILAYAKAKEEAKEIINDRAATVYLGKKQIVRLFIRKGIVVAKLIMPNNELNAYADNNDLNIKEKPIDIKVTKPELVGSVKDIIDLVYNALIVDRNRREEEKKERRRQARLAKKAQEQK